MSVLDQLNGTGIYLICGGIVLFIAAVCVVFMVRAWKAGKALGMDPVRMKRAIASSATFSVLPSVGILLGVLALSGSLGIPWPWLRLSVIGALHYETQVADAAAEQLGIRLGMDPMTTQAFSTIALLMSVCIMWGMVLATLFNRKYLNRLQGKDLSAKKSGGFGDFAMAQAMLTCFFMPPDNRSTRRSSHFSTSKGRGRGTGAPARSAKKRRFSATVASPRSAEPWGTYPTLPAIRTCPERGFRIPAASVRRVVFPDPFVPATTTHSPGPAEKFRSRSTARPLPKEKETPSKTILACVFPIPSIFRSLSSRANRTKFVLFLLHYNISLHCGQEISDGKNPP